MKKLLVGVLAFSLMAAGSLRAFPPPAERTHTKVSGDSVSVDIDFGDDEPDVPLSTLNHALASYPQQHRFYLTWTDGSLEIFHNYAALYDRRKHSVTVYCTNTEGDMDGRTWFGGHVRYTKVREKDFQKIAAAHKHDQSDNWIWFEDLTKYGCRRHELAR